MSEISPSFPHDEDPVFDPETRIPICLRLHEAIGLALLYERAPDDLDLNEDGHWYGQSLDLAMLRVAEGIAEACKSREGLLRAGALRAWFDQRGVKP